MDEASQLTDEPECPCSDMEYANHWVEDKEGNEWRVECGCKCPVCIQY